MYNFFYLLLIVSRKQKRLWWAFLLKFHWLHFPQFFFIWLAFNLLKL